MLGVCNLSVYIWFNIIYRLFNCGFVEFQRIKKISKFVQKNCCDLHHYRNTIFS